MQFEGGPPVVQAGSPEDGGKAPPDHHCNTKNFANLGQSFHALFAGLERAHGTYTNIARDQSRSDGKLKGTAVTVRAPVTDELWAEHLAGRAGIGIIPIRDDSTAVFGAIDVDAYADLDHGRIAATIERSKLPLIVCRSKSGGAHLYLFCKAVSAALLQRKLQQIAARLGFGNSEIFPKQTSMKSEKGDLASWINAPFHGDTRYAVRSDGDPMTAEEFLTAAAACMCMASAEWIAEPLPLAAAGALPDGPPCLQALMAQGFPEGTWQSGMFNLGVYCRKAQPDNWKGHLIQLNAINFPPDRWPASDLDGIMKSLSKKDYSYQCASNPLAQHCDRKTCRTRKFGVGGANSLPVLSSLTKLCTTPPIWFLEVEGHRLELTTEQLLNPLQFQVICADHSVIVPVVGRAAWTEHLRGAMATVNEIPVADDGADVDDSSPEGHFWELVEMFCTGRAQGHSLAEVSSGRPYTADGVTLFRLTDLMSFLSRKGFKHFNRRAAVGWLKKQGATNRQERVSGRPTRLWSVPAFAVDDTPFDIPASILEPRGGF
jgi:hypothetical protein